MVVFSCDGCGEMLKKSQVDSHALRCRRCDSVSCVDCSVSFYGDDYRTHTSCISEAERYEKSVYRGKEGKKTKRNPQESWMDLITSASSTAPLSIRQYLEKISTLDNVPRKPKQFRNFTANSLNLRGKHADEVVDAMWKYLSAIREKEQEARNEEQLQKKEKPSADESMDGNLCQPVGESVDSTVQPESQTTSTTVKDSEGVVTSVEDPMLEMKSKVKKAMKKLLKKAPNRSMKLKSLRRAVRDYLGDDKYCLTNLKTILSQQIDAEHKRIKLDGKVVVLR